MALLEVVEINNPFEVLGLSKMANAEEIRNAYRTLVKKCHPDQFLDADEQKAAQEKMIALNLAYEQALRLAVPRKTSSTYQHTLSVEDAIHLAEKMLRGKNPDSALHHLNRTKDRSAAWFDVQGQAFMELRQYENAHQAFREAVRRDPDNLQYRRGALDAALAMKNAQTLQGKLKNFFHKK